MSITTYGIETFTNDGLLIYPNPVADEFVIEDKGANDKIYFEIYSPIGQIVFAGSFSGKTIIHADAFPAGVYLIRLSTSKTVEFRKIVKE